MNSAALHISPIKVIPVLITVVMLTFSCKRAALNYPDVPALELVSWSQQKGSNGKDSLVIVNLKYTDGDGDLGLRDEDNQPPFDFPSRFHYNLFVPFYKFENGNFSQILLNPQPVNPADSFLNFNQRLPYLTPEGKQRGIDGTIKLTITVWLMSALPGIPPPAQGKFTITLYDRALNSSNTIDLPVMNFDW